MSNLSDTDAIAKLSEENNFLRNLIALIPGNVFWKDTKHYYLGCNNNVAYLLGLKSPAEIIGKHNSDFFSPEITVELTRTDQEIMVSGETKELEERGRNTNFEPAIYLSRKVPLRDASGHVVGLLGTAFDITDRKKIEEALKIAKEEAESANNAKTEFIATVNHELRTPLTCMAGLIGLLKKDNLPDTEKTTLLNNLENSTQYLLSLVNNILDFSQLEMKKVKINLNPVNLDSFMHNLHSLLQPLAKKKNLGFEMRLDPQLPRIIFTDLKILQQIAINFIGNAIKFTQTGKITIELIQEKILDDHCHILFRVTDTGPGIPADKLDIIFEAFQQLRNHTPSTDNNGTGLGLNIVKKLANIIQADVQVTSKIGEGSIFTLTGAFLTKDIHHQFDQLDKMQDYTLTDIKTFKPNILLIEDNPLVQYVHQQMLLDMGCSVDIAGDGNEALNKLASHHHLILCDLSLPDMSGLEVIKKIRADHPHQHVPIVALTASEDSERKKAISVNAGANDYKVKPISIEHLKQLIIHYMNVGAQTR